MAKLTDETRAHLRRRSRLVQSRPRRRAFAGLRQRAAVSRLDRALPRRRDAEEPRAALHLRHPRHADDRGAVPRPGRDIAGAAGTVLVPSGLAAIVVALMTALERRRPSADDRFRLRARARLRRQDAEAHGRSRRPITIRCVGAGIEALMRPNTKAVFDRVAGLADARDAGHPRDRRGRARARRLRHHGQHLGDAAVLLAARAWRRHGGRGGHQISLRPLRPAARPRLGQRGMVRAASSHASI